MNLFLVFCSVFRFRFAYIKFISCFVLYRWGRRTKALSTLRHFACLNGTPTSNQERVRLQLHHKNSRVFTPCWLQVNRHSRPAGIDVFFFSFSGQLYKRMKKVLDHALSTILYYKFMIEHCEDFVSGTVLNCTLEIFD